LKSEFGRTHKWAKYIRFTPDLFHLLCRLSVDKSITDAQKAKLAAAIAYFVSPLDVIPEEFHGALGFVDDIALSAYVLQEFEPAVLNAYWDKDPKIVTIIKNILADAEEMVGARYWKQIKATV
jgi:uncharacterized membrane protein YkvA (DUF1232 family)